MAETIHRLCFFFMHLFTTDESLGETARGVLHGIFGWICKELSLWTSSVGGQAPSLLW